MAVVTLALVLVFGHKKLSLDEHASGAYRWEFKENHEEWLNTAKPDLGPGIAARVQAAVETSGELVSLVQQIRNEARFAINDLLKVSLLINSFGETYGLMSS